MYLWFVYLFMIWTVMRGRKHWRGRKQTRFHMPFDFFRGLDFRVLNGAGTPNGGWEEKNTGILYFLCSLFKRGEQRLLWMSCCVSFSLQNNKMLFGEDDKRVRGAFIKSIKFIEILWTKTIKTALYCLPRGFVALSHTNFPMPRPIQGPWYEGG